MLAGRLDTDRNLTHPEIDWSRAVGFAQTEERKGHEVLRVAWCKTTGRRAKEFELSALATECLRSGHCWRSLRSAAVWPGHPRCEDAFGRKDGPCTGI